MKYKEIIDNYVRNSPLGIDPDIIIEGKVPTSVSSEFITNKEQGDWAERVVFEAIKTMEEYIPVRYGHSDNLSAGDDGFKEFYNAYQVELNTIGKKPDILVFKKSDCPDGKIDDELIKKAVCAIEVRSSSFLVNKYDYFMKNRTDKALQKCIEYKNKIFDDSTLSNLLKLKK